MSGQSCFPPEVEQLRPRFGEVAGAVTEFEFFFAEIGVGDLDGDFAIRAVAAFVGRGVGDEILRPQLLFDLCKGRR